MILTFPDRMVGTEQKKYASTRILEPFRRTSHVLTYTRSSSQAYAHAGAEGAIAQCYHGLPCRAEVLLHALARHGAAINRHRPCVTEDNCPGNAAVCIVRTRLLYNPLWLLLLSDDHSFFFYFILLYSSRGGVYSQRPPGASRGHE